MVTVEEGKGIETETRFVEACSSIAVFCRRTSSQQEEVTVSGEPYILITRIKSSAKTVPLLETMSKGAAARHHREDVEAKPQTWW